MGLAVGVPHPILSGAIFEEARKQEEIRAQLRERLAAYKIPKRVLFFDDGEISYTANQKIQVGPLRDAALARLQAESAEIDGVRYEASAEVPA